MPESDDRLRWLEVITVGDRFGCAELSPWRLLRMMKLRGAGDVKISSSSVELVVDSRLGLVKEKSVRESHSEVCSSCFRRSSSSSSSFCI